MSATHRIVVLDTETTGLDPQRDRIVEVGCVIMDGFDISEQFQEYFDPGCPVHPNAARIHGLTNEFLSRFGAFNGEKIQQIIKGATLVIHNAQFDIKFLNKEFELLGLPKITNHVIDTLDIARKLFPGAPASLDALCARFKVPNKHRQQHGALLDALLLTQVYSHLRNHGVANIDFVNTSKNVELTISQAVVNVSDAEIEVHQALLAKIAKS